jgi:hypothetical protein
MKILIAAIKKPNVEFNSLSWPAGAAQATAPELDYADPDSLQPGFQV